MLLYGNEQEQLAAVRALVERGCREAADLLQVTRPFASEAVRKSINHALEAFQELDFAESPLSGLMSDDAETRASAVGEALDGPFTEIKQKLDHVAKDSQDDGQARRALRALGELGLGAAVGAATVRMEGHWLTFARGLPPRSAELAERLLLLQTAVAILAQSRREVVHRVLLAYVGADTPSMMDSSDEQEAFVEVMRTVTESLARTRYDETVAEMTLLLEWGDEERAQAVINALRESRSNDAIAREAGS